MPLLRPIEHLWNKNVLLSVQLIIAWVLFGFPVNGQSATEVEVKAVYIYNFVNFVEWPASAFKGPADSFVIGVAGENIFGNLLNELILGETYRGRTIQVRFLTKADDADQCHIIFVERSCLFTDQLLVNVNQKPVLTISDSDAFLQAGGIIRFFLEQNKVKLEINHQAAIQCELIISSKLLRFAKHYKR